jgi:hypothetical protein
LFSVGITTESKEVTVVPNTVNVLITLNLGDSLILSVQASTLSSIRRDACLENYYYSPLLSFKLNVVSDCVYLFTAFKISKS